MRELLYAKQLDLIIRIVKTAGRIRVFTTILVGHDAQFKEEAREDLRLANTRGTQLTDDAAALLPTELFAEVRRLNDVFIDIAVKVDASQPATCAELNAQMAKTAVMARALLGVDELSDESIALFGKRNSPERLSKVGLQQFRPQRG